MKQETMRWWWHQLDHTQIICTLLQTDNHAGTSSINFFTGWMLFLTSNQQYQRNNGSIATFKHHLKTYALSLALSISLPPMLLYLQTHGETHRLCMFFYYHHNWGSPARVVRWLDHSGGMCSRVWHTLRAVGSRFNSSRGPGKARLPT